jgi:hypothetical protein
LLTQARPRRLWTNEEALTTARAIKTAPALVPPISAAGVEWPPAGCRGGGGGGTDVDDDAELETDGELGAVLGDGDGDGELVVGDGETGVGDGEVASGVTVNGSLAATVVALVAG